MFWWLHLIAKARIIMKYVKTNQALLGFLSTYNCGSSVTISSQLSVHALSSQGLLYHLKLITENVKHTSK